MSNTNNVRLLAQIDELALLPKSGFSRLPEVRRFAGNAAGSTIYLWISQGKFPRGVKLSPRVTVWACPIPPDRSDFVSRMWRK